MADAPFAGLLMRPIREDERAGLADLVRSNWGSPVAVSRGLGYDVAQLPCLLAVDGERWLGVAAYRLDRDECELVLLDALERRHGIGTALLELELEVVLRPHAIASPAGDQGPERGNEPDRG